jgi:hypothetical protein
MAKALQGDDKILSKIRALMDKAASTDSQAEKDECMKMAQKLMQNNHIEHSRVTSWEQVKEEGVEEDEIFYEEMYEAYLLHYIAMNNFCRVVLKGERRVPDYDDGYSDCKTATDKLMRPGDLMHKMAIIGEPTNVNLCLYMYSFYRNAILGLVVKSYQQFLIDQEVVVLKIKVPKGHKEKFTTNYTTGCVEGINLQLTEQREYAEKQSSQLAGIMVVKANKVDEYMKKNYPRLGSSGKGMGGNDNSTAYKSGVSDGKNVNYNQGVNQGNRGYIG